jgi:hypothetical protein
VDKTMEDLIKNYIDKNIDSYNNDNNKIFNIVNSSNNNNYIEDQNLLTLKFNTKANYHNFENITLLNKSDYDKNKKEKVIINEEKENKDEAKYQAINKNENNFISNNNQIVDTGIKYKNINININIDIPKIKKSKSIIKSLNESPKKKHHKSEKANNDENSNEKH